MKMLRDLVMIVISLTILSGCFHNKKPQQIIVQPPVVILNDIPDSLLVPCKSEEPMSEQEYLLLTPPQRETYLTNLSSSLYEVIVTCDGHISAIKEINDRGKKDANKDANKEREGVTGGT